MEISKDLLVSHFGCCPILGASTCTTERPLSLCALCRKSCVIGSFSRIAACSVSRDNRRRVRYESRRRGRGAEEAAGGFSCFSTIRRSRISILPGPLSSSRIVNSRHAARATYTANTADNSAARGGLGMDQRGRWRFEGNRYGACDATPCSSRRLV